MLDEFRSTNITWDKATSRIYSPVTANASDENGRKLVVQVVNSGQVEDLTGATLHLYWETRDKAHDGLDVFKAVDLKKGEFELSYTTGMLSNQGVLNANLVLIDTVGRVVSERFKITVTEGIDNDAIQSENSFTTLTQALIDVSNLETNYAPRLNDLTAQLQQKQIEYSKENTNRNPTPSVVTHKSVKPLVTFIDDDGSPDVLTKLKPLSETHGVPFVSALIGSYIAGNGWTITVEQALDLQNDLGWEIASHEYNHIPLNDSQYGEAEYQYELKYSAEFLREKGLNVKNVVYPYGRYNNRIKEITAQVYNCGVGTDYGINTAPLQTYQLKRIAFPGTAPNNTLAWYKSKVDEAVANNGWLIWMLHCGQEVHDATQQQILNDLIVYIKSINVDIVTIQEGLNASGNIFATNENKYYMTADGKNNIVNYANVPINTQTGTEQLSADMVPGDFELNKTYTTQIYNAVAKSKFPPNEGGIFTTVMTDSYLNSYQTYVTRERSYKRTGSGASAWGSWTRMLEATQGKVTLAETVIPANSWAFKSFSTAYYEFWYVPIFTPKVMFPSGVIFSVRHTGAYGTWTITFFNPTNAEVTVPAGEWEYMLIRM